MAEEFKPQCEAAASPSRFITALSSPLAGSPDHAVIAASPRTFRNFFTGDINQRAPACGQHQTHWPCEDTQTRAVNQEIGFL
ncbi:hypothetical protein KOW79_003043 [Hemibagrus wyckioides]|uniref:Uncharacterized protein n=1 Tax=Hemibagrus wyckioides TaxID=337641 RepID=A0A9D3P4R7_9TELE|nr:hypothetical protein KOW79_003043 [Hemibagrus wyckioides]